MKRLTPPLILVAFCLIGLAVLHADKLGINVPVIVPQPVRKAIIFYEGKTKHRLSDGVKAVIDSAPGLKLNIETLDWDVKGPDKKTPLVLVPFLVACKDRNTPQLVTLRGESDYRAQPCPDSVDKLKEAIR